MWQQLKGVLRNLVLVPVLVMVGLFIYSAFILRYKGLADVADHHDPLFYLVRRQWNFSRNEMSNPEATKPSSLEYRIDELPDGRYERMIRNTSWYPYLVVVYQSWEYKLPDSALFNYADRFILRNPSTGHEGNSGSGFYCGTGLSYSTIRPFETFRDTVSKVELLGDISLPEEIELSEGGTFLDRCTGASLFSGALPRKGYDEPNLKDKEIDDFLELIFFLPVTNYFSGRRTNVHSNGLEISRTELTHY